MGASARDQITELVGVKPWKLNPSDVLPISRPRFAWCSFARQDLPGLVWEDRGAYFEAKCSGGSLALDQWLRPGWTWAEADSETRFPTFMKSIVAFVLHTPFLAQTT